MLYSIGRKLNAYYVHMYRKRSKFQVPQLKVYIHKSLEMDGKYVKIYSIDYGNIVIIHNNAYFIFCN